MGDPRHVLAMRQILPSKTKLRHAVDYCTLPSAAFMDVSGHSGLPSSSGQGKFSKCVLLYCLSLSSFVQYRRTITVMPTSLESAYVCMEKTNYA